MGKLVYLFELDSVRNTDRQMELAMTALISEIFVNGNTVCVTYNQLIDSRFFLSLLQDEEMAESVIRLFKIGAIKISQFGKYRSCAQYLINQALDSNEEYIFSGLPIKSCQKSLIALAKRSLIYSDLTELNEYLNGHNSIKELHLLFREQVKKEDKIYIKDSSLQDFEMIKTLKDLKAILRLILHFSDIQDAYVPVKDFDAIKERLTLYDYYECVKSFDNVNIVNWDRALVIINNCLNKVSNKNKRSYILNAIYNEYQDSDLSEFEAYALAEAIIDLCYNYACEASICNVSKHYNIDEIKDRIIGFKTFKNDFSLRLKQYYEDKYLKEQFLNKESNCFSPYVFKKSLFYNLNRAYNLSSYASIYANKSINDNLLPYEYGLLAQRKVQWFKRFFGVFKRLLVTGSYLFMAFGIEEVINYGCTNVINYVDQLLNVGFYINDDNLLMMFISMLIATIFTELVSIYISKLIKHLSISSGNNSVYMMNFPTFSECLENIIMEIGDFICTISMYRKPYMNKDNMDLLYPCKRDLIKHIYYVSNSIQDYKQFRLRLSNDEERKWMFNESDNLKMLNILDLNEDVRLTRIEELTGKKYGVLYHSVFHNLICDPIVSGDNDDNLLYPYERLANSNNVEGVVIVPIIEIDGKDYFVLLKQFRHAIRKVQYSFPRGFNEDGIDLYQNVEKELYEEIGGVVELDLNSNSKSIVELGKVIPDSGSMSDSVYIMMARLVSYDVKRDHEGIIDVLVKDKDELGKMISDGLIDDSFTICAYLFYSLKKDLLKSHL